MSILIKIGDFFHRLGGKQHELPIIALPEPVPPTDLKEIQAVGQNGGPDQYRSFTEIGRQVASGLNYKLNEFTGEVFDTNGNLVAENLEILSFAMVDLGWIINNSNTESPFVDWGQVGRNNPAKATAALKAKISSYGKTYWQHLTTNHII